MNVLLALQTQDILTHCLDTGSAEQSLPGADTASSKQRMPRTASRKIRVRLCHPSQVDSSLLHGHFALLASSTALTHDYLQSWREVLICLTYAIIYTTLMERALFSNNSKFAPG